MLGKFITIEGIDGAGKSTHTNWLSEYLLQKGIQTVKTYEPGGTEIADKIRDLIKDKDNKGLCKKAELMLFMASRAEHFDKRIKPALLRGETVVCDRFVDSTVCYQGFAHGLDIDTIENIQKFVTDGTKIDLTLWLDIKPEDGFARKGGLDRDDRMELYDKAFYDSVYKGFETLAKKNKRRMVRIDASGSIQETQAQIKCQVDRLLGF
ncbi:MAG: dTMP kinase [Firmicutes bacterium]|nr:dTMP kinase [Bacillota bacterium]